MNILVLGKTATYETMLVACGILGESESLPPAFGDSAVAFSPDPIWIGCNRQGDQVFVLAVRKLEIAHRLIDELQRISRPSFPVHVVQTECPGEYFTSWLGGLAHTPVVGKAFGRWATKRAISRKRRWFAQGQSLLEQIVDQRPNKMAAKPLTTKQDNTGPEPS